MELVNEIIIFLKIVLIMKKNEQLMKKISKNQLIVLIFSTFICLIYLKILPDQSEILNIKHKFETLYMKHYNKSLKKSINKKNYNEIFVETLLVSYALYYMSSDGIVKKPNIKNIAARACMSTTKLNKIFKKFNGHLFEIKYLTKGQRVYTDSIVLSENLFNLIHVKKNQHRIHQKYVTEMIKTKLPKGPLATIVFYITVAHANQNGVSTISIKKLTGILSQKYEQRSTLQDQMEILKIESKLIELTDQRIGKKVSGKDHTEQRKNLLQKKQEIFDKKKEFRIIKAPNFNNALEENIRHEMRVLIQNDVLNKENKIFFLNLTKSTKENMKLEENINIENIEASTTNNLSFRKEKSISNDLFSKNQIHNKLNFQKFCTPCSKTKILLAKSFRFFQEKKYEKSKKYFLKNKWLAKKTFFCKKLKEKMKDFLRENVKLRSQFHLLSRYLSFFSFNGKIDLAIHLFGELRFFIQGENLFKINWDKFKFFNKLQEIYPKSVLWSGVKKC